MYINYLKSCIENEPCNFNKDVVTYMDERSYLPKLLSSHPAHTVSGEKFFYLPFLLFEPNWVEEARFYLHLRFSGSLLSVSLEMTSFFAMKRIIYLYQFKCKKFWTLNFEHFEEKNWACSFHIFQILHFERCGHLNAWKLLFVKTHEHSLCSYLKKSTFILLFWAKLIWK